MGICTFQNENQRKINLNEKKNKNQQYIIPERKNKENKNIKDIQKYNDINLKEKNELSSSDRRNNNEIKNLDQTISYKDRALSLHNKFRENHGSNKLELNSELNNIAQSFADECADIQSSEHSLQLFKDDIIGENIFELSTNELNIEEICTKWYNEKKEYDFNSNKYQNNTGHFTQMIWKDSKEVGFGFKKVNEGKCYFIAIYYPAGNIFNKFKDNVRE